MSNNRNYGMEKRGDFETDENSETMGESEYLCETVFCLKCGTDEFMVGQVAYVTVIKCKKCGWEEITHSG